ncbi:hypothetical protein LGQ02_05870 [Bacillus shivajii]|uniref:hypothetical protein n=1 Tax=Bacillus shivajii TaxID=1983719 RepID=UPI001CF93F28|nr:hypothetical protein [Bacillus shivajii]UCZ54289.1 hypothetical protein LGQ02_05870 [Bacillus shivajii]
MENSMCPVCNGYTELKVNCSNCYARLTDKGRMAEYYDDYSAYESIDLMKLENGIKDDYRSNKCAHYLFCEQCEQTTTYLVAEVNKEPL